MLMSDLRSRRASELTPVVNEASRKRRRSIHDSPLPKKMRKRDRELLLHMMMMNEASDEEDNSMA